MKVHELIAALSGLDGNAEVNICADNGTEDDPSDLSISAIRAVDDGGPYDGDPKEDGIGYTAAIWCAWGVMLDPIKAEDN